MKTINATLAALVVTTALATPTLATQEPMPPRPQSPQTQPPAPPQDAPQRPQVDMRADTAEDQMATGRLVRVDTDEMIIVIKGADDQEQQFRYTDTTKVVGAQEQVSGLSTRAGSQVIVHYTRGAGETRIATKVQFDEKK
jgi:hypothetical protein